MDINEKNLYRQKFKQAYYDILPKLQKLEKQRKKIVLIKYFTIIIAHIIYFFVMKLLGTIFLDTGLIIFFGILCYAPVIGIVLAINYGKKFSKNVKKACIWQLIKAFDFINIGIDQKFYKEIIGELHYQAAIDDVFSGLYKDVKFNIAEVYNGTSMNKEDWHGVILEIQMNKKISDNIYIKPKMINNILLLNAIIPILLIIIFLYINFVIIGDMLTILNAGMLALLIVFIFYLVNKIYNKRKISLENSNFENKFYTECDNQIEARYILTPAFMERLNNLKTAFKSGNYWVQITGGKIKFTFETKDDLFEIGNIKYKINDIRQAEQFFNEIMAITDIIDHFKLYEKTGL